MSFKIDNSRFNCNTSIFFRSILIFCDNVQLWSTIFFFLNRKWSKMRTSRTISNIDSRDEISKQLNFWRCHVHFRSKSNFFRKRQNDDQHYHWNFEFAKLIQLLQTKSKFKIIVQHDVTFVDDDTRQSFLIVKTNEKIIKNVD